MGLIRAAITTTQMAYRRKLGFLREFFVGGGGRRTKTTVMLFIPEDIIYEILSRLPVKSLLSCKCVCKNWYALISTSSFVKPHLAIQKKNPILMLNAFGGVQLYSVCYDSLPSTSPSSSVCEIKCEDMNKMYFPYETPVLHYCVDFLGSCNGIIGLWLAKLGGEGNLFCLWNPATKEYKELPESPIGFRRDNVCLHGLGYDHKTDDYKLAVGVKDPGTEDSTLVQFYTLASNTWRTEITIPYRFCYLEISGVLVNGYLHWLALAQFDFLLLSLDVSDESFRELQLPREFVKMNKKDLCLGVLQQCLCLLVGSYVNGVKSHFEVWEMLDYGVQDSWTKRYAISQESIMNDRRYFRLVWSFKEDEILLLSDEILVLCDAEHGSARELKIDNVLNNAETYFESLVSLNSGTYMVGERKSTTEIARNLRKICVYGFCFLLFIYTFWYLSMMSIFD